MALRRAPIAFEGVVIRGRRIQGPRYGIEFERFPGMLQDRLGIWKSPSGAQVAWFKDPDGNILSITAG